MLNIPVNLNQLIKVPPTLLGKIQPKPPSIFSKLCAQIRQKFSPLLDKRGVHTVIRMTTAGFHYTGDGDRARCDSCILEVSNWTSDMDPWTIHSTRSPDCPFVCSLRPLPLSDEHSSPSRPPDARLNPLKRRRTETVNSQPSPSASVEARLLEQARRRTFVNWPHHPTISIEQMIDAGFTACNVGDRVTCSDCNIFFHHWTPYVDEPSEVHKAISPQCQYVREKLVSNEQPRIANGDQSLSGAYISNHSSAQIATNSCQFNQSLCSPAPKTGNENDLRTSSPVSEMSITDEIRADSFFSRIKHDETCVECKKSLHNIDCYDNQTADFARWFVHCVHTKQYTADQVYNQIRKVKQARQRIPENNTSDDRISDTAPTTNDQQLTAPNTNILPDLPGRLGLQIPQQLLEQDFCISILRRIWISGCRLHYNDSLCDIDLLLACSILQNETVHINGNKENLIKPNARVTAIREQAKKEEAEKLAQNLAAARSDSTGQGRSEHTPPASPCVLCLTQDKRVACLPCGHLAACISCSEGLRACPICRCEINLFLRIYT